MRHVSPPYRTASASARYCFSPCRADAIPADKRRWLRGWIRELYFRLSADNETLFLAATPRELELGALPGATTLCTPRAPQLLGEAIARCDGLITLDRRRARDAHALGRPVAWLSVEPLDAAEAAAALSIDPGVRPHQAAAWALTRLAEQSPTAAAPLPAKPSEVGIATIADRQHLPFLAGFIENLRRHAFPLEKLTILALDDSTTLALKTLYPANLPRLCEPDDLWQPNELRLVASRGPAAVAFSSKARLIRHALARERLPVLYSDIDIFYYEPPQNLAAELGDADVTLFPQWNDRLWYSKFYGVFNAGMVGARPGAEPFLDWWAERCLRDYNADFRTGYFADQGFLDLAPVHFPGLRIYRKRDHNIAYWNTDNTVHSFHPPGEDRPRLRDGLPIASFHAAVPDRLGIYEHKFGWDQIVAFASPLAGTLRTERLTQAVTLQQSEHWLAVARLRKLEERLPFSLPLWDPSVSRILLHSPARWLLHWVARAHYHALRWSREVAGYARWFRRRARPKAAATNRSHYRLMRRSASDSR